VKKALRDLSVYLLLVLAPLPFATADFEAGLDAIDRNDYGAAYAEFKTLADQGDPDAQVNLGNLYMRGLGVAQDYAAAFDWYRKAADQNNAVAEGKLGILHYYGLGTIRDSDQAAKCFRKAAEQGEASAQTVLGTLYAQGEGVIRDPVEAYFWLTLAFDYGSEGAAQTRASVAEEMSPGEIAEALTKVEEWKRKKGIPDPGGMSPLGTQFSEESTESAEPARPRKGAKKPQRKLAR